MYSEEKYGITFSIDARVELIFGMLSKLKKEDLKLEEKLDFIEGFDDKYSSEYANRLYEIIDFKAYPQMLKWALKLSQVPSCDVVPNIAMMISDSFSSKEIDKNDKYFKMFFTENSYDEFISDINEFIQKEKYLEFYKSNFDEFHKMVEQSTKWYPKDMDVKDLEECYGAKLPKYPVIYSVFFNGGFGPKVDGIPTCFKGLWIENGEYIESTSYIVNLYHEYSHSFINPLVDRYWENFDNAEEFLEYSIQNNLHPTYRGNSKTLYYEYYVRAMAHILSSKYEDCTRFIERFEKLGFVKFGEIVEFITNNFQIGNKFEEFFVSKLIPFTNSLVGNLENIKHQSNKKR